MAIKWNFVIGITLLIVNSTVATVDLLQNGIAWPCLVVAAGLQVVILIMQGVRN